MSHVCAAENSDQAKDVCENDLETKLVKKLKFFAENVTKLHKINFKTEEERNILIETLLESYDIKNLIGKEFVNRAVTE